MYILPLQYEEKIKKKRGGTEFALHKKKKNR
jgi:hypothetical protein